MHPVPSLTTFLLFAFATFLLTASPGPGVLYVMARSVAQGRAAGFASMFGIEAGGLGAPHPRDEQRRQPREPTEMAD